MHLAKQQTTQILLVEDNRDHADLIARYFAKSRDQVDLVVVDSLATARAALGNSSPSVVLCDYLLPDGTGLELLHSHIEGVAQAPSFVLLTSQGDEMVAVEAMKAGATDYIIKSETSLSSLPEICRAIAREGEQRREMLRTQRELSEKQTLNEMLLAALPHPAMLIRGTDRTIVAANEKALECGACIGDHCWRSFARRTLQRSGTTDRDAQGPCSICRGDECLFEGKEQNDPEVQADDKVYDIYWIKVSESLFLHYVIDVTERQKLQRDLVQMSREQSATLSAASVGIAMVKNRVLLWGNRALGEIFGYRLEELRNVDTGLLYLSPESYRATGEQAYASLAESSNYTTNLEMRRKDGSGVWIQLQGRAIDQETSVWVFQDITRHRLLEEQLHQSQKVEAIGQLAGGIAHDFNNILTVIIGYCALLEADCHLGHQQREAVEQIMNSSEKAAQLTRGLLAFSRKQVIALKKANLNDIVQRIQKLLVRIIGEDIQFKLRIGEPSLPVKVDNGQIEQVLINLATNARDAMPRGGTLTIETGRVTPQLPLQPGSPDEVSGPLACISIADTGNGMDEATRSRIFEPFFTTKEVGKGTGLGMSIVYGIVQQHNGLIEVVSSPGRGTRISLYLPLAAEGDADASDASAHREIRGGSETILLGEDDPGVRKLVATALATYGYRVIEAHDGEDAVEKFTLHRKEIDFILMDMIMPRKSGREAYEEIIRIKPGVKVLFLSGYTADFIKGRGLVAEEGIELVMKPVQPVDLLAKIRQILDAKGPAPRHLTAPVPGLP
jgi:PAS domain S-box-containing protein